MNEDLILATLKEIRDDQKQMFSEINKITRELEITRNGYQPHQIVELLHWVEKTMQAEQQRTSNIKRAVINWITPILLSAVVIGMFQFYK